MDEALHRDPPGRTPTILTGVVIGPVALGAGEPVVSVVGSLWRIAVVPGGIVVGDGVGDGLRRRRRA